MIAAALAAMAKSCSVLHFLPLISQRLHACHPVNIVSISTGYIPISTQGLTTNSVLSAQTKPGSPNSRTNSMRVAKVSLLVSPRTSKAELFDLPRWGLSMNQLPTFAVAISMSSGENKQIVADLRTPPDKTASEACIIMS